MDRFTSWIRGTLSYGSNTETPPPSAETTVSIAAPKPTTVPQYPITTTKDVQTQGPREPGHNDWVVVHDVDELQVLQHDMAAERKNSPPASIRAVLSVSTELLTASEDVEFPSSIDGEFEPSLASSLGSEDDALATDVTANVVSGGTASLGRTHEFLRMQLARPMPFQDLATHQANRTLNVAQKLVQAQRLVFQAQKWQQKYERKIQRPPRTKMQTPRSEPFFHTLRFPNNQRERTNRRM